MLADFPTEPVCDNQCNDTRHHLHTTGFWGCARNFTL
jgi:hypothetical protein